MIILFIFLFGKGNTLDIFYATTQHKNKKINIQSSYKMLYNFPIRMSHKTFFKVILQKKTCLFSVYIHNKIFFYDSIILCKKGEILNEKNRI